MMMDHLTSGLFADRDQSSHSEDQMTKTGLLHYNKDLLGRTTTHFWKGQQRHSLQEVTDCHNNSGSTERIVDKQTP